MLVIVPESVKQMEWRAFKSRDGENLPWLGGAPSSRQSQYQRESRVPKAEHQNVGLGPGSMMKKCSVPCVRRLAIEEA
jgi:hypothetical protein